MSIELILGIDPGTAITGYGVVAKESGGAVSLVECGVVRTSSGEVLAVRIRDIYEAVTTLRPGIRAGKFHGENAATGPMGW